jgi:hypothetical protein
VRAQGAIAGLMLYAAGVLTSLGWVGVAIAAVLAFAAGVLLREAVDS